MYYVGVQHQDFQDPTYAPGQVWSYHHRPGEERSTLTILKVERVTNQGTLLFQVVHIRVDNISIQEADGAVITMLHHLPFSREAIEQSVVALIHSKVGVPDFSVRYNQWLHSDSTGIYTTSVANALNLVAAALGRENKLGV